jgi:hypothetical protein
MLVISGRRVEAGGLADGVGSGCRDRAWMCQRV